MLPVFDPVLNRYSPTLGLIVGCHAVKQSTLWSFNMAMKYHNKAFSNGNRISLDVISEVENGKHIPPTPDSPVVL